MFLLLIVLPALLLSIYAAWTTATEMSRHDQRHQTRTSHGALLSLMVAMFVVAPFTLLEPWFCVITNRRMG